MLCRVWFVYPRWLLVFKTRVPSSFEKQLQPVAFVYRHPADCLARSLMPSHYTMPQTNGLPVMLSICTARVMLSNSSLIILPSSSSTMVFITWSNLRWLMVSKARLMSIPSKWHDPPTSSPSTEVLHHIKTHHVVLGYWLYLPYPQNLSQTINLPVTIVTNVINR